MQPFCWGPLRVGLAERMLLANFLRPDAMPIRLEQKLFLLIDGATREEMRRHLNQDGGALRGAPPPSPSPPPGGAPPWCGALSHR